MKQQKSIKNIKYEPTWGTDARKIPLQSHLPDIGPRSSPSLRGRTPRTNRFPVDFTLSGAVGARKFPLHQETNKYLHKYIYIHIYFTMSAMSSHGSWVMMLKYTFFSKKSHSPPGIPWTETSNSSRRATSWSDDIRWVAKPHANASRPQDARTASQCENTPKTGCQPSNSDTSPRNMGEYSWRIKCTPESAELWWYGHFLKSSELRNAIHQPELDQKKCVWDSKLVGVFTPPKLHIDSYSHSDHHPK